MAQQVDLNTNTQGVRPENNGRYNPYVANIKSKKAIFNNKKNVSKNGLQVEHKNNSNNSEKTIYLQSGRKVVYTRLKDGRCVCKYYGADGTQINADYFKKVEGSITIGADDSSYTITKNGKSKNYKAKDARKGSIDQNIAKLNNQEKDLNKTKKEQGLIGKGWDWLKNKTGFGDGSDKALKQIDGERKLLTQLRDNGKVNAQEFEKITGQKCTKANLEKFRKGELSQSEQKVKGYQEGQEEALDAAGDMISGIAAFGIYTAAVAAAPFTGGASIALGFGVAALSGAAIKTGVKALDSVTGGRQYSLKDAGHDALTGAFSGALAPFTGGLGGAVGKTVAAKLGIQAVKQVGKTAAEELVETGAKQTLKQGLKTALTNPAGYEYIGGSITKRAAAMAAEMGTDGALGGAIDNSFRTAIDGGSLQDIASSAIQGAAGGAIMSPVMGGGMKVFGKGAQKVFGKENVKIDANGKRIDDTPETAPKTNLPYGKEIFIPKGKLAGTISKFNETDNAFRSIVTNRAKDIQELDKINDMDEFCRKSFDLIKEEMGLKDSGIKLKINDKDNMYDHETNTVYISRNWAGHIKKNVKGQGDKAEIFGGIAHEMNHYLQWKEVVLNLDMDDPNYMKILEYLQSHEGASENMQYVIEHYPDNTGLKAAYEKAKTYMDNWLHYNIPPENKTSIKEQVQYERYKNQPVEKESFRRGDIVVEEYRKIIESKSEVLKAGKTTPEHGAVKSQNAAAPAAKKPYTAPETEQVSINTTEDLMSGASGGKSHRIKDIFNPSTESIKSILKDHNISDEAIKKLQTIFEKRTGIKIEDAFATPYEFKAVIRSIEKDYKSLGELKDIYEVYEDEIIGFIVNSCTVKQTGTADIILKYTFKQKDGRLYNLFDGFNLSDYEMSQLENAIKSYNHDGIREILRSNNEEIYIKLSSFFQSDRFDSNIEELEKVLRSSKIKEKIPQCDIGTVNGRRLLLDCSDNQLAYRIQHGAKYNKGSYNTDVLLKSNLITDDAIEVLKQSGIDYNKSFKGSTYTITDTNTNIDYSIGQIVEKYNQDGIEALNTNEIHVLTDYLRDLYKKNPLFKANLDKIISSKENIKILREHLSAIRSEFDTRLKDSSLIADDHFICRMVDRNYINILSLPSEQFEAGFINPIKNIGKTLNVGSNKELCIDIPGLPSIKIKITKLENGKIKLDTII